MKTLYIITLALVCLGGHHQSYGKIKNGYGKEIKKAENRIRNLNDIAKGELSKDQQIRLNKWLKAIYATAEKLRENYAKTQIVIEKLRMIDLGLYDEINTIQDCEGNDIDVYIKIVDDLGPRLLGATNVNHSGDNPNVYSSEYGDYTVSVKVSDKNAIWNLWILIHELGHVRYQVPHLAEYTAYYRQFYPNSNIIGHRNNDPSHQSVQETLKTFKASWKGYKQEMKWIAKNKSRKMLASNTENRTTNLLQFTDRLRTRNN